ncbi:MAG: tyrosine--tRNA ligase [Patescibacteria group bacterium]
MSVSTDPSAIANLLTRGVENVYPSREYLEARLREGKQLTLYCGYDPTAPTLHIGHGITLLKLRQFQDLGHKIIMLIGDFTGMIGDPTDKSATRKRLTHDEAIANCKRYQDQVVSILRFDGDNAAEMRFNNDWLGKMSFADVVELAAHFTVQQMMERDMFERRIEEGKPIYLHEFLYPLMQGYDTVAMDVDGEVGGNDQTFNMLAGRTLMKEMKGKEKFVLTSKLLVAADGKKMGKSEGNMISLEDSAEDMFGKVMRWEDGMIDLGYELCTRVSLEEIAAMRDARAAGTNPRDHKLRLAFEVTRTFLGDKAAEDGRAYFSQVIQQRQTPDDMPVIEIREPEMNIVDLLVRAGLTESKSEARRVVEEGGVTVEQQTVRDISTIVKIGTGVTIQKGKRHFTRVMPRND